MKIPKLKLKKAKDYNSYSESKIRTGRLAEGENRPPTTLPRELAPFLKRLPRVLGGNAFLTFLGLLIIALILGGLIFYKYSILAKKVEPQVIKEPLQFKEKTFQDALKIWQEKEKRFNETDLKIYPDPFR